MEQLLYRLDAELKPENVRFGFNEIIITEKQFPYAFHTINAQIARICQEIITLLYLEESQIQQPITVFEYPWIFECLNPEEFLDYSLDKQLKKDESLKSDVAAIRNRSLKIRREYIALFGFDEGCAYNTHAAMLKKQLKEHCRARFPREGKANQIASAIHYHIEQCVRNSILVEEALQITYFAEFYENNKRFDSYRDWLSQSHAFSTVQS